MDIRQLFEKTQSGEISMNQAYKQYQNAGGEGTIKDFINRGVESGYISENWNNADGKLKKAIGKAVQGGYVDQLFNTTSAFLHTKYDSEGNVNQIATPCDEGYEKDANGICVPVKKKVSPWLWAGIGVFVVGAVITGVYLYKKNKK